MENSAAINTPFKIPKTNTIVEDRAGNIWYVIKETLGILKKNNNGTYTNTTTPFLNFTQYLVYNNLSINTLDSKNIFIGLTDGLIHYDSKQLNNINNKPKVFIQNFTTPEKTIFFASPPAAKTRANSPALTISKPAPKRAKTFKMAKLLLAFMA